MSYEATISLYGGNTAVMAKSFIMVVRNVAQTWYSSLKLLRKCVILLKMITTEGPSTSSFVKRAHSTKMNGTMILIMVALLLMMLLPWQQNCRLFHGHNPTSHLSYPCTMGTQTQNNF